MATPPVIVNCCESTQPAQLKVSYDRQSCTARGAHAEREHILGALRETGWVVGSPKGTAARLGMKRSTLYKKIKKLGIFRLE
jgi:transcriptional regulator of acetoin/glycerol metabolism